MIVPGFLLAKVFLLAPPPFRLNVSQFLRDAGPCVAPVPVPSQELIVPRFCVANVGSHSQIDGILG